MIGGQRLNSLFQGEPLTETHPVTNHQSPITVGLRPTRLWLTRQISPDSGELALAYMRRGMRPAR